MPAPIPITIIGGGLAGLSLGIGLRRYAIPVTILEAKHYPRHRVCGEFINGRGLDLLDQLELVPLLQRAGIELARTVVFHWAGKSSLLRTLPIHAIAISRFILDDLLARTFAAAGGHLQTGHAWRGPFTGPGIVQASGRASCPIQGSWRWYGLKVHAHARNLPLQADLEMHARPDGYVGVSRLPGNEINICGLFRRPSGSAQPPPPWDQTLRGPPGTPLHQLLSKATLLPDTFCSIAGLPASPPLAGLLRRSGRPSFQQPLRIGDALAMIPPVTGNGMSMAFESAAIALPVLVAYSRRQISWDDALARIATECHRRFASRLLWAKCLQHLILSHRIPSFAAGLLLNSVTLWRLFLRKTR